MRRGKSLSWMLSIFYCDGNPIDGLGSVQVGPFEITGFYQYTWRRRTEHANPNNLNALVSL